MFRIQVAATLWVVAALAQSVDVTLNGLVRDPSGAVLADATVRATNTQSGLTRSAITGPDGRYILLNLPAGTYDVEAGKPDFAREVRKDQTFYVGTTITLDFTLQLASQAQMIEVSALATTLEVTKQTLARTVQFTEIDSLPVIGRNFNDLAALAPGVTRTGVYGGVDISGSRDFQNGLQVDGVSSERQSLGDQRINYAQDWVQEFQVMTSQYNAEFGQSSGGVLNVITRSGSNQIHGRVYSFLRKDAFDALPEFTTTKPPLDQKRIGATLGGPVRKDRLFYFGGYEWFNNQSSSIVNSTFPALNGPVPAESTQHLYLGKVDFLASTAHTLRFRYNTQRADTINSSIGGVNTEEHGRFSNFKAQDFLGNWTAVISARATNDVRVAFNTYYPQGGCNFARRNPPGTWFERFYPGTRLGCPVNFGTLAENQNQFIDNYSLVAGSHEIKAGAQFYRSRSFGDFRNFRDGQYSFERDLPFSLSNPDSYPFFFTIIQGPTAWDRSGWSYGFFAQDSWKIHSSFTLNFGLRYDVDGSYTMLNPLVRIDRGLHRIDKDLNNVAPRVGFAWTPFHDNRRTVIRGGVGLNYDQNHNNVSTILLLNTILVDRQLNINANNSLQNPWWPDIARAKRFLAEAFAENRIPDTSSLGPVIGGTNDIDQGVQIPATFQVSSGVGHEFGRGLTFTADFVHSRGFDQYIIRNTNVDPVRFQRINPNYTSIRSFGNGGWIRYKALQTQINYTPNPKRLLKLSYTLASTRNNTNSSLSGGGATNPFDYSEDEGPADNDVRHVLSMSGASALPLGIQVSGILSYLSALPYSADTAAPRPDGKPFGWRPEPRNTRRGGDSFSLDTRFGKTFRFRERAGITGFAEIFNLTNHINYGGFIATITSSRFGQPTVAGPKRRMQLGFRLDF